MRNYHFVKLFLIATVAYGISFVGVMLVLGAGLVPHLFGFHGETFWLPFPAAEACIGIFAASVLFRGAMNAVYSVILALKGVRLDVPSSPEGLSVAPTGVWFEDNAELPIGSKVLALRHGGWHRAEVIRVVVRERVWVHFPGWDSFWDEPFRKKDLQAPIDSGESRSTPETDTRIVEK